VKPAWWMKRAVAFEFEIPHRHFFGVNDRHPATIEFKGRGWAVLHCGLVLDKKEGDFGYEPQPSSRDDEFFSRCRFRTREAARKALEKWCRKAIREAKAHEKRRAAEAKKKKPETC
jgi:hypothetical protein